MPEENAMTATNSASPDEEQPSPAPAFPMQRIVTRPFDPPPLMATLQRRAPLVRVRLWDGSTPWLVTRHAEQRVLLSDPRVSADITRPGYPRTVSLRPHDVNPSISFIQMDDPDHARLRRTVTQAFAIRRIKAMRPTVQRIVDTQTDTLLAGPRPVDLVEAFALPIPSLVICSLLGVPYADHAMFQENSRKLIGLMEPPEERGVAFSILHDYLNDLMERKLVAPQDDLLSQLNTRIAAGEITRAEAVTMAILLLIAGHETTANMIALGTLALLEYPNQLARLRDTDDPKLVASAVEELLRYLTINHAGRRRVALEDIEIAGHTVKAGEGLIMASDIGNRDEQVFNDPDSLDISSDARRHLAFGLGAHQCLGQSLARMELQVVYGTLYRRIPTLRLATELNKIPFKHDGSIFGVHELPVTW
jgi:cytochrome P450